MWRSHSFGEEKGAPAKERYLLGSSEVSSSGCKEDRLKDTACGMFEGHLEVAPNSPEKDDVQLKSFTDCAAVSFEQFWSFSCK